MKEKIIKIIQRNLKCIVMNPQPINISVNGLSKTADAIIKGMDKACCEKCRYYSDKFDKCEYHLMEITDAKILKCNDFTETEGK